MFWAHSGLPGRGGRQCPTGVTLYCRIFQQTLEQVECGIVTIYRYRFRPGVGEGGQHLAVGIVFARCCSRAASTCGMHPGRPAGPVISHIGPYVAGIHFVMDNPVVDTSELVVLPAVAAGQKIQCGRITVTLSAEPMLGIV